MKILYIFRSIALLAGMERILTDKMNYLSDQLGHDVYLITYEQGTHPLSYALSPRITYLDLDVPFYTNSKYPLFKRIPIYLEMRRKFRLRLREFVYKVAPDIIVSTNYSYPILDIIHQVSGNSKLVLETHVSKGALLKTFEFNHFSLFKVFAYLYDYYMLLQIKKYDVLVTLTAEDQKKWERSIKTIVIPNVLTCYPESTASLREKKIISVGRFYPQKGYDLLILAWVCVVAKHPDWQIHVYGSGPDRPVLQTMIKESQLESSFILHNPTSTIYEKYFHSSLYVMSSRYEGFGLVLIEAMSCGVPCISFDCPSGPSEVIKNGEDGLLVENGNIEKLSETICYLIENEEVRKQMGRKARENVRRYTKDNIMRHWEILFKELI